MKKLILILTLAGFPLLSGSPVTNQSEILFRCKKQYFLDNVYSYDFSTELFKEALVYAGIRYPEIAYKQAVLETANFTSELFVMANNLFGIRPAKKRETTNQGCYLWHAYYLHWWDSVKDYKLLIDYWSCKSPITDYYSFLQEIGYATDPNYIKKLQNLDIV